MKDITVNRKHLRVDLPRLPKDRAGAIINQWFEDHYPGEELPPTEFYRFLFPDGELETRQERDERVKGRYAAIGVIPPLTDESGEKIIKAARGFKLTDELDNLDHIFQLAGDRPAIMAPISYAGATAKATNARKLYAICLDVDDIMARSRTDLYPQGLEQLEYQTSKQMPEPQRLPRPTVAVSSGSGIHLYWILEHPMRMFPHIIEQYRKLRRRLVKLCWGYGISARPDDIEYEGPFQQFRLIGGATKYGTKVRAWKIGEKTTLEAINKFMPEDCRVVDEEYHSKYALKAMDETPPELRPEWWDDWKKRRIDNHEPRKTWDVKRAVYDWWKGKALDEVQTGHRYFAMMITAIYAVKCNIPLDELEKDIREMARYLDLHSPADGSNNITELDIRDALKAYDPVYNTYPINSIAFLADVEIEKNRRNGQKQKYHLEDIRDKKAKMKRRGQAFKNPEGRPKKAQIVAEWRAAHPAGRKIDCERELKISRPTILKWWNN